MAAGNKDDPKVRALRETRSLNPRAEAVSDPAFTASEFFDTRDLVQVKYEMLRRSRIDGVPVATGSAAFGFSRPSFYQAQSAFERAGVQGLVPARPGPRQAHKLSDEVVDFLEQQIARGEAPRHRVGANGQGALRSGRAPAQHRARPRSAGKNGAPRHRADEYRVARSGCGAL